MVRCALKSLYIGQSFRYLGHHHITHTKFFKATWSETLRRKLTKTKEFWETQLALKNKIFSFARFPRLSFTSTFRNVMILCSLDNLGLGQAFKWLERYHITHRKNFRDTWSQKLHPELTKIKKFRESQLTLKKQDFFVSSGRTFWLQVALNFFTDDVITFKVFKRLS